MFLIKASKARQITKDHEKFLKREKIKKLNKIIKNTALSGKHAIDLYYPLGKDVIEILEKNGYTVKTINYTYFFISW